MRPYVRLEGRQGRARPWTSKLGGVPYRPRGNAWLLAQDGTPLAFLAQLNLAELPPLEGFPTQGIVQFFIRDDDYYGTNLDQALDMTSLGDQANFRVLYHPEVLTDGARLETSVPPRIPDPHGGGLPHDPEQEFVLRGTLASGPVTSGDRLFEHLVGRSLWEIGEAADADTEPDSLSERYARLAGEGHKLGGTRTSPSRTRAPRRTPTCCFSSWTAATTWT